MDTEELEEFDRRVRAGIYDDRGVAQVLDAFQLYPKDEFLRCRRHLIRRAKTVAAYLTANGFEPPAKWPFRHDNDEHRPAWHVAGAWISLSGASPRAEYQIGLSRTGILLGAEPNQDRTGFEHIWTAKFVDGTRIEDDFVEFRDSGQADRPGFYHNDFNIADLLLDLAVSEMKYA